MYRNYLSAYTTSAFVSEDKINDKIQKTAPGRTWLTRSMNYAHQGYAGRSHAPAQLYFIRPPDGSAFYEKVKHRRRPLRAPYSHSHSQGKKRQTERQTREKDRQLR